MDDGQDIPDSIIGVVLSVVTNRLAVARVEQRRMESRVCTRRVVVGDLHRRMQHTGVLAEMFASAGRLQPVERIVIVISRWFYALVSEVNYVVNVSIVAQPGNVTHGIVQISQSLHRARIRVDIRSSGGEGSKPVRLSIVR